jgi:serine/threonine protein kinase/DNA-binding beta-propeller fold protein YncE
LEHEIGRGGMGVVYCARHVHLDRRVAVKLLSPERAETEEARRRFIRESRLSASLSHPNIVTVYDAGEAGGQLYIAMQFIDGEDLHTLRRAQHVFSPERVLWILEQVASALDAAHARGLVHRDVKPGNILVDEEKAYLSDFGLTKNRQLSPRTSTITEAGGFRGTVDYVAPEQITGGEIDGRTDLYALGCVVYECLTGEVPFPRPYAPTTLSAHIADPIPQLTAKRPDLPPAIDDVVYRALAKRKEDRYDTCHDLYVAAAEALDHAPATAPAPSRITRRPPSDPNAPTDPDGAPPVRRRLPVVAGVAVALGIVALAVALIATSGGGPTPAAHTAPSPKPSSTSKPKPMGIVADPPVQVGKRPFGIAYGAGSVWVASFDRDWLTRLDPKDGHVMGAHIRVGDGPFGVTVSRGFVWVALKHADLVQRIDPAINEPRAEVRPCGGPVEVLPAAGSIWVACESDHSVARINPSTNAVVGHTALNDLPRGMTATRGVLWVAMRRKQAVARISTATGRMIGQPIRVGRDPHFMTVARGQVWVTNNGDDTVSRIAIKSGHVVGKPIRVGAGPFGIVAGLGYIWVADFGGNTVVRLNPQTGRIVDKPIKVGSAPAGLAIGAGAVWTANEAQGSVSRIKPPPRNA